MYDLYDGFQSPKAYRPSGLRLPGDEEQDEYEYFAQAVSTDPNAPPRMEVATPALGTKSQEIIDAMSGVPQFGSTSVPDFESKDFDVEDVLAPMEKESKAYDSYLRQLSEPPPTKPPGFLRRLAAGALGAGAGWINSNPNMRPVDVSSGVDTLLNEPERRAREDWALRIKQASDAAAAEAKRNADLNAENTARARIATSVAQLNRVNAMNAATTARSNDVARRSESQERVSQAKLDEAARVRREIDAKIQAIVDNPDIPEHIKNAVLANSAAKGSVRDSNSTRYTVSGPDASAATGVITAQEAQRRVEFDAQTKRLAATRTGAGGRGGSRSGPDDAFVRSLIKGDFNAQMKEINDTNAAIRRLEDERNRLEMVINTARIKASQNNGTLDPAEAAKARAAHDRLKEINKSGGEFETLHARKRTLWEIRNDMQHKATQGRIGAPRTVEAQPNLPGAVGSPARPTQRAPRNPFN